MALARHRMLDRMQARDPAWDGRFITGVLSTGIYCLPSCPAKNPKPENVRFFPSPEDAREAGLRACKRCRPDDFYRRHDPDRTLVEKLVRALRRDPGLFPGLRDLADEAEIGGSKLHALFRRHYHTTPHELMRRARVEAACRLLEASDLGVAEIAFEVGWGSLSSFQEGFRRRCSLPPTEFRALRSARELTLRLPRNLPISRILSYLGRDAENPCLKVDGTSLAVGYEAEGVALKLRAKIQPGSLHAQIDSAGPLPPRAAYIAHRLLHRVLGLGTEAGPFERSAKGWPELDPLVRRRPGLRVPRTLDLFEGLIWVVVGQQVHLKFACTLYRRLAERYGRLAPGGMRTFPSARLLAEAEPSELEGLRLSRRKAAVIVDLARRRRDGRLDLEGLSATSAAERLLAVPGLGPWSAGYLLMRGLGFEDAVPTGDAGLRRALRRVLPLDENPSSEQMELQMERYRPHRSLATFHLWQSLEDPS